MSRNFLGRRVQICGKSEIESETVICVRALKTIVLDASVAVKWILNEAESEKALKLRHDFLAEKIRALVPSHFFTETCNVLSKKAPEETVHFLSYLQMTPLEEYRLSLKLATLAMALIKKYPRVSFYDASYHALAIQEKGTFITCDTRYFQIAKKERHIRLLKNY